jgi:hypothetical protein
LRRCGGAWPPRERRSRTIACMSPTVFWTQLAITVCVLISVIIAIVRLV